MKATRAASVLFTLGSMLLPLAGCSERSEPAGSANNAPMVIEPNLQVGEIHSGMTVQQVVARLGEPQRRTANSWEYTRLGLALMADGDGIVQVVMCGDVTGINGPFTKAFTGRTKEGIGMYSTRADVLKAYGEPSEAKKLAGGLESFQYKPIGITFTLEGGKVHHMIVRLGGLQQPDRTVNLVPVAN